MAAATALLAHRALAAALGDGPRARFGALLVAAWPQAAFLNGVVSPDGLCTLLWTATLWALLAQGGRLAFVAGLLGGGAYLAKSFGFSAFCFGAAFLATRRGVGRGLAFASGAALVVAPWVAWAAKRPGGLVGLEAGGPVGAERIFDLFRVTTPWTLFSQAWGVFGWLDAPLPLALRLGLAAVSLAAVVGLLGEVRRGAGRGTGLLLGAALLHAAWIIGSVGFFYIRTGYLVGLQGRYFLHPLAAWAGLLATGLAGRGERAARAWSLAFAGLALYSLSVAWTRYYGPA